MPDSTLTSSLAAFKEAFVKNLHAFTENRHEEIGVPGQWKLVLLAKRSREKKYIATFLNKEGAKISFSLPLPPKDLTSEEKTALRVFMKEECVKKGFRITPTRSQYLSSEVMDGVRKGDPRSWEIFIGKHLKKFEDGAARALHDQNPTILEAEDIANRAIFDVFKACAAGSVGPNQQPQSFIHQRMRPRRLPKTILLREADGRDLDDFTDPGSEFDEGIGVTLHNQLPEILARTREKLHARRATEQIKVLDMIIAQGGEEHDSLAAIAQKKGVSREAVRLNMKRITKSMHEAALELGYDESASLIAWLIHANSRGRTQRS